MSSSSSSQIGLKRTKKSGAQNRKDTKKRKEENKVLSGSMKNFLLGKTVQKPVIQKSNKEPSKSDEYHEDTDIETLNNQRININVIDIIMQDKQNENQIEFPKEVCDQHKSPEEVDESRMKETYVTNYGSGSECEDIRKKNIVDSDDLISFDAFSLVRERLSSDEKYRLLEMEPCQPPSTYLVERKKLCKSVLRCCSQSVFFHEDNSRRKWITYSKSKDALFCIPCLLFSDSASRGENQRTNQGNSFTCAGFSSWHKQYSSVPNHEKTQSHKEAVIAQALFLQEKTLKDLLNKQEESSRLRRKRKVEANRNVMQRIVDTISFLGKQGLAFRGHREHVDDDSSNAGNFIEALKYLSQYDPVIYLHLEKVKEYQEGKPGKPQGKVGRGKKLTFLSMTTQNKIIDIIGNEIAAEISLRIKDCRAWALIADTTPDITKHEQLSVCVRIVEKNGNVAEHLLFCTRASSTTSKALYKAISSGLKEKGVSFENLVAQTYDGASNMSGQYKGLQALIKQNIGEHVIFIHCYAHTLNLVLSSAATASIHVCKLFDDLEKLYTMFSRSQPIHEMFEKRQKEKGLKILSLKRINTVRWNAREFCLRTFVDRYSAVNDVLEEISTNTSIKSETRSIAEGLLDTFKTKQFLATAYLFREIFAITGPLSRQLQSINIDFNRSLDLLDTALQQLYTLRQAPENIIESVERDFNPEEVQWKETRLRKKKKMDGEEADDEPAATAESLWRREGFTCSIDAITEGIKNRFSGGSRTILEALSILSPSYFSELAVKYPTAADLEKKVNRFCALYNIDTFKCADELFSFSKVFKKFKRELFVEDKKEQSDENDELNVSDENDEYNGGNQKNEPTLLDCLAILSDGRFNLMDAFPTLIKVYSIAVAIPVTSASSERSFSVLKRVKSRIRSSMTQERLEALLLMTIERNILVSMDKEKIIDIFGRSSSELTNALL